jgi:hypothetical protein
MDQPKKSGLSPFALFRCFPTANKWFVACAISYAVANGVLIILSSTEPSLFSKWLGVSEPWTTWTSHFFPGIDEATRILKGNNRNELIPAIRNALFLNFALLFVFPTPIVVASLVDLKKSPEHIIRKVDLAISRTGRSISFFHAGYWLFTIIILSTVYFGFGIRPWGLNLVSEYIAYAIIFSSCDCSLCGSIILSFLTYSRKRQRKSDPINKHNAM